VAIFDYVMLLISVVLSLGLARLLETHARLIKRGRAVQWSATYLAWFAIVGALHVDLWATLWAVHTNTHWPWTVVMGFFFQAVALFYGAVLLAPDDPAETIDLWWFHLENRRRYLPAVILYTLLGCWLSLTFLPGEQFLSAVYTVGLPVVVACVLAMATSALWAQRAIAGSMVVWVAWYFATYLPGFSA
jgi:hypothetical protein